ncbi:MAG: ATP-binding response regulator [Opitutaceae bacterium]
MLKSAERTNLKRLLVVDDEEGPRQSLNMIFSDDFDVTVAASGEEAITLSNQNPFNVVITDIRMRGLSGIDVLRELKRIDSHTEVVVLTAFETLETARQAISFGASEYLKKPFDLEHIQKVVDRCYDNYLFSTKQNAVIRQDVNAAKSNFLEIVSHELNTPMNGILGFIDLLKDTRLDDDQSECVENIHNCSVQYFEHVQDILTYAKLTNSDSDLSKGSFNPVTLTLKLLNEVKPRAGVVLDSEMPHGLTQYVSGPEQEIRIVVRKLLQNAVKFTESGSILVKLSTLLGVDGQVQLLYAISDTGPGIDPSLLDEGIIFDAFTQGDSSASRSHEGLGLGLALCRALSDRMNGGFAVESCLGKGSTFTFTVTVLIDGMSGR